MKTSILKKLSLVSSAHELEESIALNFQEIYDFLNNQKTKDLRAIQDDIQSYFFKSQKIILALDNKKELNLNFISLLAQVCSKLSLLNEFNKLYQYLQRSETYIDKTLVATKEYCSVDKLSDFFEIYPKILDILDEAMQEEPKEILTAKFLHFYLYLIYQYGDIKANHSKIIALTNNMKEYYHSKKYIFLDKNIIQKILNENFFDYDRLVSIFDEYLEQKRIICYDKNIIFEDDTQYSKILRNMVNIKCEDLYIIAREYIDKNIKDEQSLYHELQRGVKIIDTQEQLFQYIKAYFYMHKLKLYQSYDKIIANLDNNTINIIDWGCGQAFATTLLLEYIKINKLDIKISNIKLIEPSYLALRRGLLHVDVFKNEDIFVEGINKDIDSLKKEDLVFENDNATLHLFSNILDVPFFNLNKEFLSKISDTLHKKNYFICVSPNINHARNQRLDIFYKYFDDNFSTTLISKRNSDIDKYKRYEIIFKLII